MSLYDRKPMNNYGQYTESSFAQSDMALVSFVKQTYQLFAGSLLAATIGAYIGISTLGGVVAQYYIGFVILELALLVGLFFTKAKPGINLLMLFAFTFVSGLTLTPILSRVLGMPGGASIVAQAFLLTTAIFGVMSIFALRTKKDLASMGKILFIALIVVVIGSLINLFLGSPILQVAIAGVSAILFSIFIAYDTQNIVRGLYDSPVTAAVSLYLDFLNLFVSLLQLLGIFGSREE
ncbi:MULTISPECIES: Bax inhibitor-1/YccA family protein [Helicobacter]|uniref:Bax inhibitor-1/YccA family protein n=1 Tax=Helicobacter colisuis TaxID=2949739 RepID=A0ABT0TSX4_9HELI|nr:MULTISPECIES: Bax inhibitor-1/YccA family protein [Helicobacter]MCI2235725.1 Bax inhibitor-1/YccA family protein [Helicobacter sp. CaF467b]MCI7765247.1 Bax inhibitor-1/YccA family protein [Helicobacter sp.]MCL9819021.1 Bax inhibitor-1/YccA family protein [Helicobacter colisuis]MCL9822865.1 Bax inhibitor-1/YccA family protein [Helicobacter colisuis]MDY4426938.1 Bax inhibitor-1/YccA family protein [Helicobacter sp.]